MTDLSPNQIEEIELFGAIPAFAVNKFSFIITPTYVRLGFAEGMVTGELGVENLRCAILMTRTDAKEMAERLMMHLAEGERN